MSNLILTVGLPRSGKSTWARTQTFPIVNPDSIRMALHGQRFAPNAEEFVWATARLMVRSLFLAGHDTVILDACNVTQRRRQNWVGSEWKTWFRPIADHRLVSWDSRFMLAVCLERAEASADRYILPIINKMHREAEPLSVTETGMIWPGCLGEGESRIVPANEP